MAEISKKGQLDQYGFAIEGSQPVSDSPAQGKETIQHLALNIPRL